MYPKKKYRKKVSSKAKKKPYRIARTYSSELLHLMDFFNDAEEYKWWKAPSRYLDTMACPHNRINSQAKIALRQFIVNGHEYGKVQFWESILGYSLDEFRSNIESKFQPRMNWANYGKDGWVLGHKRPLAGFYCVSLDSEQFKHAWSLDNLVPIWHTNIKRHHR